MYSAFLIISDKLETPAACNTSPINFSITYSSLIVLSSNSKQATAIPQNQPKPQPQKPQAQPQKPQPKPQAQGRPQPRPQPKPQPKPQPQSQPQPKPVENEEFDYSDFEK